MLLCRVNVDFQSQSVCPVGVVSSTIDPDQLPPNRLFVVNITEVSRLHLTLTELTSKDSDFWLNVWIFNGCILS